MLFYVLLASQPLPSIYWPLHMHPFAYLPTNTLTGSLSHLSYIYLTGASRRAATSSASDPAVTLSRLPSCLSIQLTASPPTHPASGSSHYASNPFSTIPCYLSQMFRFLRYFSCTRHFSTQASAPSSQDLEAWARGAWCRAAGCAPGV